MESSIKHLKLVNGEEIVCDVLDESPDSIAIRNAYSLHEKIDEDGYKYFTFKSFMLYQENPLNVMLLMGDKIMAMALPTPEMREQYSIALEELERHFEEKEKEQQMDLAYEEWYEEKAEALEDIEVPKDKKLH